MNFAYTTKSKWVKMAPIVDPHIEAVIQAEPEIIKNHRNGVIEKDLYIYKAKVKVSHPTSTVTVHDEAFQFSEDAFPLLRPFNRTAIRKIHFCFHGVPKRICVSSNRIFYIDKKELVERYGEEVTKNLILQTIYDNVTSIVRSYAELYGAYFTVESYVSTLLLKNGRPATDESPAYRATATALTKKISRTFGYHKEKASLFADIMIDIHKLRHDGASQAVAKAPRRNNGQAFEKKCAERFSKLGMKVIETGGTGDFGADMIISAGDKKYVVQCKDHSGSVGVEAVQAALAARLYYNAQGAIALARDDFTSAALELAAKTGVVCLTFGRLKKGSLQEALEYLEKAS